MDNEFTLDQAIAAQRALRSSLGLGEETFPIEAFVGMISDEIEQSRAAGKSDKDIVEMIREVTGKTIDPQTLQTFYATPEERHGSRRGV